MARRPHCPFTAGVMLLAATLGALPGFPTRLLAQAEVQPEDFNVRICPLTPQQEEAAPKAFAAMVPVYTHPRCINCHGAINPFDAETRHVGGRVGKSFTEITVHDDILGRDVSLPMIDEEDKWKRCEDCHSAVAGRWSEPSPEDWFVGKTTLQLCEKNKGFQLAQNYLDHIARDNGRTPLIQEAFKGTRGLDENGRATYENETGKDFQPEPPPISHARFLEQAQAWVQAMGGEFTGGLDCGCRPHQYALELRYHLLHQDRGTRLASEAKAILPIKFVKFKEFTAEGGTELNMIISIHTADMDCKDGYMRTNPHWQATGRVGGIYRDPKLELQLILDMPPGYIAPQTCTVHGHTSTSAGVQTVSYRGYALPPVTLDAEVGAKTTIDQGPALQLDIKVIQQQ